MIYLNYYLSVMFEISDVMIDKEEIAMQMQMPIHIPKEKAETCVSKTVTEEQISVSEEFSCVPVPHMKYIVQKVAELLKTQGIPCCECPKTQYILSPLSACKDIVYQFSLKIICPYGNKTFRFILTIPLDNSSGIDCPNSKPTAKMKGDV